MTGKLLKLVLAALLLLLTGGCYGYHEVDESAHIIALGVDRGREDILSVTAQIAVPRAIAGAADGGGGGGPENTLIVTVESPTILSAFELFNSFVQRRIDLNHTKAFFFSQELAEDGLERYLAPMTRFRHFRRHTFLMITTCPARDFIGEIRPVMEDNPSKYLELLAGGERHAGFIPATTVHRIYNAHKSLSEEPMVALAGLQREDAPAMSSSTGAAGRYLAGQLPREGGTKPELMGAAVLRQGKLAGFLNGYEVGLVKMVRGDLRTTVISMIDPLHPDRFVIFEIRPQKHPEIEVSRGNGMESISSQVFLEGTILSIQSGENYEDPEKTHIIERALERQLASEIAALVRKTQAEFRSDIFGFGNGFRRLFSTWPEWVEYDWLGRYPRAAVDVSVRFKIRRTGLLQNTFTIDEEGGFNR